MALAAASFSLLLLVTVPLGHAIRLQGRQAQSVHGHTASLTQPSAMVVPSPAMIGTFSHESEGFSDVLEIKEGGTATSEPRNSDGPLRQRSGMLICRGKLRVMWTNGETTDIVKEDDGLLLTPQSGGPTIKYNVGKPKIVPRKIVPGTYEFHVEDSGDVLQIDVQEIIGRSLKADVMEIKEDGTTTGKSYGLDANTFERAGTWEASDDGKLCVKWTNGKEDAYVSEYIVENDGLSLKPEPRLSRMPCKYNVVKPDGGYSVEKKPKTVPGKIVPGTYRCENEYTVNVMEIKEDGTATIVYIGSGVRGQIETRKELEGTWEASDDGKLCFKWTDGAEDAYVVKSDGLSYTHHRGSDLTYVRAK